MPSPRTRYHGDRQTGKKRKTDRPKLEGRISVCGRWTKAQPRSIQYSGMQLAFANRPAGLKNKGITDMGPVRWLCVLNKALSLHKDEEKNEPSLHRHKKNKVANAHLRVVVVCPPVVEILLLSWF